MKLMASIWKGRVDICMGQTSTFSLAELFIFLSMERFSKAFKQTPRVPNGILLKIG